MYKRVKAGDGVSRRRRLTRAIAALTSACAVGVGVVAVTAGSAAAAEASSTSASDAPSPADSTPPPDTTPAPDPTTASAPDSTVAPVPDSATASLFAWCPDRETSTPFAPWGDDNSYTAIPGGTFEDGGADWTLSGATIVPDNEDFHVNDANDTQSLSLTGDAQATSPDTCVDLATHTIRMFVKRTGGDADSTLHIRASVEDPLTGLVLTTGHDISGGAETSTWSPSDQILIPNILGGLLVTGRLSLTFTTTGTPATWNVDDVYLDPFKSH